MKNTNKIIAVLILLLNIYFLIFTFRAVIGTVNPSWSFLFSIHVFLITALLAFKTKYADSVVILVINVIGAAWTLFSFLLLVTVPALG